VGNWNDRTKWQGLLDGSGCPICVRGEPLDIIAGLASSWLTMPERAAVPGYVCLVSRVHAVELHDLTDAQAASFMRDVRRVSAAVSLVTGAVKLNYEIHGNVLPHLHMHFFPRRVGDRFEGRLIDPGIAVPIYAAGEHDAIRERLVRELGTGAVSVSPDPVPADRATLEGIVRQLEQAWNAMDGPAFAAPFAVDADFVNIRGEHARGRTAIAAGHTAIFRTIYAGSTVQLTIESMRLLDPEVALVRVLSRLNAPHGPLAGRHAARFSLALTREDGAWEIAALHNTVVEQRGGLPDD
jgi:uncharacterized protein (TIGR02246 family)